ncbi:hypothetical protein SCB49_10672 [unidentified eubacterium SCB49]|nr:hypothetical protein SCB49_10672 [unidentified eubacterium SCB49]
MKLWFLVILLLSLCYTSIGQVSISDNQSAQDLINDLLGDSENISLSNITINGNKKSYGLFRSKLKYNDFFNSGVILTNGLAENAKGPNDDTKKSAKVNFNSVTMILTK